MLRNQALPVKTFRMSEGISAFRILKRIFDFLFASVLLVVLFPLLFIISIIIIIETGSNPIFNQMRGLTLEGTHFRIFKFRTLQKEVNTIIESSPILIKDNLSDLVTASGNILRKTGLDELPQLINIILGEMSFIGPRPLSLSDLGEMKKSDYHYYSRRRTVSSKPGISGYWQIYGKRTEGIKNLIELEEYYESNKSFFLDMFLIFMTIPIVLFAKHTDAIVGKKKYF